MLFFIIFLFTISCEKDEKEKIQVPIDSNYTELLEILKKGFIDRDKINWIILENKLSELNDKPKDSVIKELLTSIGNNHTHYITKEGRLIFGSFPKVAMDNSCLLKNNSSSEFTKISNVSYLNIDSHGYKKVINDEEYVFNKMKIISESVNSKFWIIDLRNNSGGSNWVMISSLLPFYNDGILGYTKTLNDEISWTKRNGSIFNDTTNITEQIIGTRLNFKVNAKKIYVLINHNTSSAAEAVLISLKSLPNTIILGQKTYGAATMNANILLNNGDKLVMTSGYMMDSNKNIFPNGIKPDVELCNENEIIEYLNKDIMRD